MTSLGRLELELKDIVESEEFQQARALLRRVGDLRFHIEHERYLEKYGPTDRPRGDGI